MKAKILILLSALFLMCCSKTGPVEAKFEYNGHAIPGEPFTLINTSIGEYSDVLWEFGDGETSNSKSKEITHTFGDNYTYYVTLTVWNKENMDEYTHKIYSWSED